MTTDATLTGETKLYRHFDATGQLLYVGISLSAIHRLQQHKRTAHWASQIANVTIEPHPTRAAALAAEREAIRQENPAHNVQRHAARKAPKVCTADLPYVEIPKLDIENGRLVRSVLRISRTQWDAAVDQAHRAARVSRNAGKRSGGVAANAAS